MEATLDPALVDQDGDPLPDTVPLWLEAQRLRLGRQQKGWPRYLSERLKVHVRTVERWLAGSKKPEPAVCRALRLALASPAEAEAMRCLAGALRALQAAQNERGPGGAVVSATREGAARSGVAGPSLPAPVSLGTPTPVPPGLSLSEIRKGRQKP